MDTDGYIELRKYIDVGREPEGDHVYLVNHNGEQHIPVAGKVGYPYFGQLILDCLNRTEKAMSRAHAFKLIPSEIGTGRCPVCFSRENDVTLFEPAPAQFYCPKCSFNGSLEDVKEMYVDLRKNIAW